MMELLVVLLCIALNGALAALEVAFVSASKVALMAQTSPTDVRVRRLLHLRERPERALSVMQVGITLVGIVSGTVGGIGAHEFVSPLAQSSMGVSAGTAEVVAIVSVAISLTFVTVVLGELVPKVFALRHAEVIALRGAQWLHLMERMLLPIVEIFAWTTKALVTRIPGRLVGTVGAGVPAAAGGPRPHYALDLLDLAQRRVCDAMLPWSETARADASLPPQAVVELALSSGHTRLPVVRDDEVIGLLHTKELMSFLAAGELDWRSLVRPAVTIGPDDSLLGVLRLLQARRSHLAVVVAPDGALLGVVTLEDILEEVLGDIYDEDDDRAVARLLASRGKLKTVTAPGSL